MNIPKWTKTMIALAWLLTIAACTSLPDQVKNEIYNQYGNAVKIEVVGKGKVPSDAKDLGIIGAICYRIRWIEPASSDWIECKVATRMKNNWHSNWSACCMWQEYSCPGEDISSPIDQ